MTIHVLGQSDTTTTRGPLANPPVTSDTTKVFAGASELDPFYFGWNKGDVTTTHLSEPVPISLYWLMGLFE